MNLVMFSARIYDPLPLRRRHFALVKFERHRGEGTLNYRECGA